MNAVVLALVVLLPGCAWWIAPAPLPARPILPEVRYVAPADPKAVAGLTEEAVEALLPRQAVGVERASEVEQDGRNHEVLSSRAGG